MVHGSSLYLPGASGSSGKGFLKLQGAGLKLRSEKCHFVQKTVKYLGHVVSAKGICPDPAKTDVVANYPIPKNAREVKQFMVSATIIADLLKAIPKLQHHYKFKLLSKENVKCFMWTSSCQFSIGAVLSRMKKFTSFWRGLYTVIDQLNAAVDYRIQLVGSTKMLIVHRNRLKRFYGLSKNSVKESRQKDSNLKAVHTRSVPEKDPVSTDDDSPVVTTEQAGGFVDEVMSDHTPEDTPVPVCRTQRIRQPTDRYGIYIEH
eukprot:Em0021g525a